MQDIASSGLSFVVVRTGKTDSQEDGDIEGSYNVAVGAQGSLPPQSRISKGQVLPRLYLKPPPALLQPRPRHEPGCQMQYTPL
jgi:hypothetical protein